MLLYFFQLISPISNAEEECLPSSCPSPLKDFQLDDKVSIKNLNLHLLCFVFSSLHLQMSIAPSYWSPAFARSEPKSIKRLMIWLPFYAFGLRPCKSCTKNNDEIELKCQFYQHFTDSFYAYRSQKCKKYSQAVSLFCAFWICTHMSFL